MMEDTKSQTSEQSPSPNEPSSGGALVEPFACPNCGQMLGPGCTVCAACREAVDFAKVRVAVTPPNIAASLSPASQKRIPLARAQFSLVIFLISLVAYFILVHLAERLRVDIHAEPFWVGLVTDCALSAFGSVWLYREGRTGQIKRPLLWSLGFLFISILCYLAISYCAENLLNSPNFKPVEAGLLVHSVVGVYCPLAVSISCAIWILYDAYARQVPHRLRWSLGSLLIWIFVFPWYLSRRRTPKVHCLIMEAEGRAFAWTVTWLILLYAVLGMILSPLLRGH